jgi:hypothetical protein
MSIPTLTYTPVCHVSIVPWTERLSSLVCSRSKAGPTKVGANLLWRQLHQQNVVSAYLPLEAIGK